MRCICHAGWTPAGSSVPGVLEVKETGMFTVCTGPRVKRLCGVLGLGLWNCGILRAQCMLFAVRESWQFRV